MNVRQLTRLPRLLVLVLLISAPSMEAGLFLRSGANVYAQNGTVHRVNAPYNVPGHEAAVFWLGRVTPDENYADARVGYRDEYIYVHLNIMDRRLWYDLTPSPADLTHWDAVSLYFDVVSDIENAALSTAYRFDAQLVWWEDRSPYQAAYRNDVGTWSLVSLPFTTESSWSGDVPNTDVDDRGWSLLYYIPFTSLGLDSMPAQGTMWRMALVLHDRDEGQGPPLSSQTWPAAMAAADPTTWGELVFGASLPYTSPPATLGGEIIIRHGSDNAVVVDADVGGSSVCGAEASPDYFPTWGELNYAGKTFLNVQNLGYISEWPCFSKYYVTFPLDVLPSGKVVLSAELTLYQFGNAGAGLGPKPSLIQVSTIDQAWEEDAITWNNAPLAVENVAASWIDPLDELPDWPGIPRDWDVSYAVSDAYATGEPLCLVLYSPDWDFHSGKYFYSSDIGGSGEGRPTLTINWGEPVAQLDKMADMAGADYGDTVTYALQLRGTGVTLTLTDTLPSAVEWVDSVAWFGTVVAPVYDPGQHLLLWQDSPALDEKVHITYTVNINTFDREPLVNIAELVDQGGYKSNATATVIANPKRCYLPLLLKL